MIQNRTFVHDPAMQHRTVDTTLTVRGPDREPLRDTAVVVEQRGHEFLFGCIGFELVGLANREAGPDGSAADARGSAPSRPAPTSALPTAEPAAMPPWKTAPFSADAVSPLGPCPARRRTASCCDTAMTEKVPPHTLTATTATAGDGASRRTTNDASRTATAASVTACGRASASRPPARLPTTPATPKAAKTSPREWGGTPTSSSR